MKKFLYIVEFTPGGQSFPDYKTRIELLANSEIEAKEVLFQHIISRYQNRIKRNDSIKEILVSCVDFAIPGILNDRMAH